jgi:hypothetical protein
LTEGSDSTQCSGSTDEDTNATSGNSSRKVSGSTQSSKLNQQWYSDTAKSSPEGSQVASSNGSLETSYDCIEGGNGQCGVCRQSSDVGKASQGSGHGGEAETKGSENSAIASTADLLADSSVLRQECSAESGTFASLGGGECLAITLLL